MLSLIGCFYCGRIYGKSYSGFPPLFKTVDHIVPKSKGGNNSPMNTVFCCNACNSFKKDLMPAVFEGVLKKYRKAGIYHLRYNRHDIKTMLVTVHRLVGYVKANRSKLMKANEASKN